MRNFGHTPKAGPTREAQPAAAKASPSRALMALGRPMRPWLLAATVAPFLAGLLLLPQAWLLSALVQRGLIDAVPPATLLPTALEIAALITFRAALVGGGEAAGGHAAAGIVAGLRRRLFRHLLAQRPDWSAARPSGSLTGAIVDQTAALDGFFARYLPAMALAGALPPIFAAVTFAVDPVVGILFLVTAPLIPVFMALVGWGAEAANRRHQQAFLRLSGFFADRLRGLVTLKLLGRAEAEAMALRRAGDDLRERTLAVLRIAFLSSAVLEFFAALGVAGVALYVGLSYLGFLHLRATPLTLQAGLFCLLMAPEVYLPLRQFAAHYHDRAAAMATAESLHALFGALPIEDAASSAAPSPRSMERGALSVLVSGLTITTPDGTRPVFSGAEFAAAPGAHVAILGGSGSGKSTLLEALARLREATGGIELGGVPLSAVDENALRARVAVLGQHPRLFDGSIADNIRLGDAEASDEAVRAAATRAGVLHFTDDLPEGLATRIGDGGLGLSGGEAHRVALSRLFLRNPDLILLDEPTAHLDRDTEALVIDGILDFARGRTLFVATHSAAVAARMDRALRIEARRIFATPHRARNATCPNRKGAA